ncbi:MAG: hypothetical protein ACLU6B_10700 [Lachnospirales bacterium]
MRKTTVQSAFQRIGGGCEPVQKTVPFHFPSSGEEPQGWQPVSCR